MKCGKKEQPDNSIQFRLRRENGKYLDTVKIPSPQYPISSAPEVFTKQTSEPACTNETVRAIYDALEYKPGYCFSTSEELTSKLINAGFSATLYVGWMFVSPEEYPIHHCWVVLDGRWVLDPAEDTEIFRRVWIAIREKDPDLSIPEVNVKTIKMMQQIPNSAKKPLGVPSAGIVYCGSPDTAENGRKTNCYLREKYPKHKAFSNVLENGRTKTQELLYGA